MKLCIALQIRGYTRTTRKRLPILTPHVSTVTLDWRGRGAQLGIQWGIEATGALFGLSVIPLAAAGQTVRLRGDAMPEGKYHNPKKLELLHFTTPHASLANGEGPQLASLPDQIYVFRHLLRSDPNTVQKTSYQIR